MRRTRIIFAVTGSVAAVKGPEIAVRLADEFDVHILFTQGGENFWRQGEKYNPRYWNLYTRTYNPNMISCEYGSISEDL